MRPAVLRSTCKCRTPFKTLVRDFNAAMKGHKRLSIAEAAELACVRTYKGDRSAPQLRRFLVTSLEARWLGDCRVEGSGKDRVVVYDPGWQMRPRVET